MNRLIEEASKIYDRSRVGIRFAPFGLFNDIHDSDPLALYQAKLEAASCAGVGYIHIIRPPVTGNIDRENPAPEIDVVAMARAAYDGVIMAAGNYVRLSAEQELATEDCDLIAFGRPFVSNPDLVRRFRENLPLAALREVCDELSALDRESPGPPRPRVIFSLMTRFGLLWSANPADPQAWGSWLAANAPGSRWLNLRRGRRRLLVGFKDDPA
jgi:N-ethylmaleimide reductase